MRLFFDKASTLKASGIIWIIASSLFFAANFITQLTWHNPGYSLMHNNISDLGHVTCQNTIEHVRFICSPGHEFFNVAAMIGGICIMLGVALTHRIWATNSKAWLARIFLFLGGLGWFLAGRYPFDVNENWHVLAALLILIFGNIGLVLTFWGLKKESEIIRIRQLAFAFGAIGLLGGFLHFGGQYLGLGMGGMERVSIFPYPLWVLLAGTLIVRKSKEAV